MSKFRKKPIVVDAIMWTGGDDAVLSEFCGKHWNRADAVDERGPDDTENVVLWNQQEQQWINLPVGRWVIRGVRGEYYPCSPEVFDATYEAVEP